MDPLPPINKVFALISQEENQRNVVASVIDFVLFTIKHDVNKGNHGRFGKKEMPVCTHCGFHGHTIDKCYKLHGYPPGFKSKQRNPSHTNSVHINSHQVTSNVVIQVSDVHLT